MSRRPTRTGIGGANAACTCGWWVGSRNALGLAAQHYDRCGGTVTVEVIRVVVYGELEADPRRPAA